MKIILKIELEMPTAKFFLALNGANRMAAKNLAETALREAFASVPGVKFAITEEPAK